MRKTILMLMVLGVSLAPLKAFGEYLLGFGNWACDAGVRAGEGAIKVGVNAGKAALRQGLTLWDHLSLQKAYPSHKGG